MPLLGSFALERLKLLAQFGELLGNEESISRIVDKKPSLASRIWQPLKGFVKRIAGIQSSQADRIRQAEAMFRKALETVGIETMCRISRQYRSPSLATLLVRGIS